MYSVIKYFSLLVLSLFFPLLWHSSLRVLRLKVMWLENGRKCAEIIWLSKKSEEEKVMKSICVSDVDDTVWLRNCVRELEMNMMVVK